MNLGINGLYKLVSHEMDLPPLSGAVFIFCAKAEVVADAINMRQAAFIILFVSIVKLLLIVIVYIN